MGAAHLENVCLWKRHPRQKSFQRGQTLFVMSRKPSVPAEAEYVTSIVT